MSGNIMHYEMFNADCSDLGFHCPIIVFVTPNGVRWNVGNLSKVMWNSTTAIHPSWGHTDDTLEAYRHNINGTTDKWFDWAELKEMLCVDEPNDDHRLTWWAGLEQ